MTVLVTGAGGQLGSVLLRRLLEHGRDAVGTLSPRAASAETRTHRSVELTEPSAVSALFATLRPALVVHAAAIASVAYAHAHPDRARAVNVGATQNLAREARAAGARFVYVSTDMVFDGEQAPYAESATPAPCSVYGRSKLEGERAALAEGGALVVRLPLLFGFPATPCKTTFVAQVEALRAGDELRLFQDEYRTPLWLDDAADALLRAADSGLRGVLHAGGPERMSRLALGLAMADALGVEAPNVRAVDRNTVPASEPRPRDLSLDSSAFARALGVAPGRPVQSALRRAFAAHP